MGHPSNLSALPESSLLALLNDQPIALQVSPCSSALNALYIWVEGDTLQARTLLQLAAAMGAMHCASALLQAGASPNIVSPTDGRTAMHCACGADPSLYSSELVAMLLRHGAQVSITDACGNQPSDLLAQMNASRNQRNQRPERSSSYFDEKFQSDDFRMFSFKIESCPKLGELHDWNECPYVHPGERARRRDPRVWIYEAVPCPEFRKGSCKRGDACTFAHGVFECWLHPSRYRTALCRDGPACPRSVCFFAHTIDQLRDPSPPLGHALRPLAVNIAPTSSQHGMYNVPPSSPGSTLHCAMSSGATSRCSSPSFGNAFLSQGKCSWHGSIEASSLTLAQSVDSLPHPLLESSGVAPISAVSTRTKQSQATANTSHAALQRILETAALGPSAVQCRDSLEASLNALSKSQNTGTSKNTTMPFGLSKNASILEDESIGLHDLVGELQL